MPDLAAVVADAEEAEAILAVQDTTEDVTENLMMPEVAMSAVETGVVQDLMSTIRQNVLFAQARQGFTSRRRAAGQNASN